MRGGGRRPVGRAQLTTRPTVESPRRRGVKRRNSRRTPAGPSERRGRHRLLARRVRRRGRPTRMQPLSSWRLRAWGCRAAGRGLHLRRRRRPWRHRAMGKRTPWSKTLLCRCRAGYAPPVLEEVGPTGAEPGALVQWTPCRRRSRATGLGRAGWRSGRGRRRPASTRDGRRRALSLGGARTGRRPTRPRGRRHRSA